MSNSWRRASLYGGALFFNSNDMTLNVQRVRDMVSQQTETTDGQGFITITTDSSTGTRYVDLDGTTTVIPPPDEAGLDEEMAQTIGRLVDDGSVIVDEENGAAVILGGEEQKPAPPKDETPKQKRARRRKEDPEVYKQVAIQHLTDKRNRQKIQLSQKTRVPLCDGTVKPNELFITTNGITFSTSDKPTFNDVNRTQSSIIFDKNFNEISSVHSKSHRFKRVYLKQIGLDNVRANPHVIKGVVVERDVFMESKGRKIEIIRRKDMPFHSIMERRKTIIKGLERAERTINWLVACLRNVFPEEDFDVIYPVSNYDSEVMFTILMRFKNIEIKNSIEMTHQIGDMIVKMYGTCISSQDKVRVEMGSSVYGTRMTFDITDALSNYQHSHIPSQMNNFNSFCTGDQYYGSNGRIDEMEFESLLHRLNELVRWESLEGGPHMRMENITLLGNRYNLQKNFTRIDRYAKRLIRSINENPEKFDVFKNCFSIYNDKGVVRFRTDKPRFYSIFIKILGKEKIKAIHASLAMDLYSYNQSTNTFKTIKSRRVDSPREMRKNAITHLKAFKPIYMSGKYHRVTLDTTNAEDLIDQLNLCPHPDTMDDIANHILFKLTEKLNEHGKTSE